MIKGTCFIVLRWMLSIGLLLKSQSNSVRIRFLSWQMLLSPSTGFGLTSLYTTASIANSLMSSAIDHSATSAIGLNFQLSAIVKTENFLIRFLHWIRSSKIIRYFYRVCRRCLKNTLYIYQPMTCQTCFSAIKRVHSKKKMPLAANQEVVTWTYDICNMLTFCS